MKTINETNSTELIDCNQLNKSYDVFTQTRKINIFLTMFIIVIGLIGNTLTASVFSHKKFRTNSSGVYLLCLAFSDGLFLVLHFFEDTLRTYKDVYLSSRKEVLHPSCGFYVHSDSYFNGDSIYHLVNSFNFTDKFDITCRLLNYFRYLLRFISAYIIVFFTIQRAAVVHSPLKDNFKSKRSAWIVVLIISTLASVMSGWVPFMFKTQSYEDKLYCDIQKEYSKEYFRLTIAYISIIMLIPIVTIFVGNSIIISSTFRANLKRKNLQNMPSLKNSQNYSYVRSQSASTKSEKKSLNKRNKFSKPNHGHSTKITRMLIFVSLSYAILNLPYFITWCFFFYGMAFREITQVNRNYLFASIQISELFYILNYGIHFYIYCASGKNFRDNIKSMFKQLCFKR